MELAPYVKRVRARIEKNADSPAWNLLAERWGALIDHAKAHEQECQTGRPFNRHERDALCEALRVALHVEPEAVMATAIAAFMMQEEQPRRFKSDRAFLFQLARRVRALTDINAGTYWDHKAQRVKRVYRDVAPRTLEQFGRIVSETFGAAGIFVARLEQREADEKSQQQAALHEALEALT